MVKPRKKAFKAGDRVKLTRYMLKVYKNQPSVLKLGTGTVTRVTILLAPNYYGYHVKFPSKGRTLLLGQGALEKAKK